MRVTPLIICLLSISVFFAGCLSDKIEGEIHLEVDDIEYRSFSGDEYSIMITVDLSNDLNRKMIIGKEDFKIMTYDGMIFNSSDCSTRGDLESGKNESYRVWWPSISKQHMADSISISPILENGDPIISEWVELDFEMIFLRNKLFSASNTWDESIEFQRPKAVAVGNFDNNRDKNIAVASFGVSSNDLQYPRQDTYYWVDDGLFIDEQGPPEFKDPANSTRYGYGISARDLVVGDIDLDGLDDIAICYWNSAIVEIFLQKEDHSIDRIPDHVLITPDQPFNLTIEDINLDGKPDIAVIAGHDDREDDLENLSVYLQMENGSFSPEPDTYFTGENGYFAFHDLLESSGLELIFGSTIFSFDLTGDLNGVFRFNTTNNGQILITDIDRNGYDDVIIGQDLFLRSNEGNFQSEPSISFGLFEKPIAEDIDGNGRLDILISDTIFFQDHNGSFQEMDRDVLDLDGLINWVEDLDGDGALDIMTIFGDEILIYYGDHDMDKDGFLDPFDWFPNDPSEWDPRGVEGYS